MVMRCPLDFRHLTAEIYHKKTGRSVVVCQDCNLEIWHTPDVSDYEVEEVQEKPKEKKIKKDIPLLFTLPGTHPAKYDDGQYFRYNMGHQSPEGLWHVEKASVKNCKRWECELDWDKEPDDANDTAGPLFTESMVIYDQIREFQGKILSILQTGDLRTTFRDIWEFFFRPVSWSADTIKKQVGDKKPKLVKIEPPDTQDSYWERMISLHGDPEILVKQNLTTATIKYIAESGNLILLTRTVRKMHGSLVPKEWTREMRQNLSLVLIGQLKKLTPANRKFNVYHYVVSFDPSTPYESAFEYRQISHEAQSISQEAGIFGGVMIFHPFRIPGEFNDRTEMATGPHFHVIGFGHLIQGKTEEIYNRDNVTIKVMHYDRDNGHVGVVRSVFDTAEYILSHHGRAWDRNRILDDLERYNEWVNTHNRNSMVTFILPRPKSNLTIEELLKDLGIPEQNHTPLKDSDYFDPVDIESVTGDSLTWHKFLRSPFGHFVLFHLDYLKSVDRLPHLSKSNLEEKTRLHPIGQIRWFGIMGNSKKHLVGIKRKKPEFLCPVCDIVIPQKNMYFVKVRKPADSVLGPKGPPGDPLMDDLGLSGDTDKWILSTEIGEYFPEFVTEDGRNTGIYLVPENCIRTIDQNVKRYLFV